jgi:hypothetical protein
MITLCGRLSAAGRKAIRSLLAFLHCRLKQQAKAKFRLKIDLALANCCGDSPKSWRDLWHPGGPNRRLSIVKSRAK